MKAWPAPKGLPSDWIHLAADHADAVAEFMQAAGRFSPGRWMQPLAPGKWSPAEVTSHVAESYHVLRSELGGAAGMRLRLSPWQRWLLRHTMMPRILRGSPFPAGARAPAEIRPRTIEQDPSAGLAMLAAGAEAFVQELSARAAGQRVRLTHAYFGQLSARQSLQLVAVHTRHHARQLAAAPL